MRRRVLLGLSLAAALVSPVVAASCSSSTDAGSGAHSGSGGSGLADGGDSGTSAGGSGGSPLFDQSSCTTGQPCGDGGVCAGDVCCAPALACGDACCQTPEVCSFQKCVTPGADCHDSSDCSASEYCEHSLGEPTDAGAPDGACMGGAAQPSGKCLPRPPTCAPDAGVPDGGALDCLEQCEYHPQNAFNPVLKVAWGGQITSPFATDVMMAPIVVELDDDDCDGKVTEKDIPEIAFTTFTGGSYGANGTLHAVSYLNGSLVEKWNAAGIHPSDQLAGGNIDGAAGNELVACLDGGGTRAFHGDGTVLWSVPTSCYMPSIADLDGDGHPEVVVDGGILDGATGALKTAFTPALDSHFVVSDLDGDGALDIVTASRGYHADGTMFVDAGLSGSTWPAVADLDLDGKPEVVTIHNTNHTVAVWRYDAAQPSKYSIVRGPVDINGNLSPSLCQVGYWGNLHGGGPPTIADFNGDGTPDVGLAGGIGYAVFDGKKLVDPNVAGTDTMLWITQTQDCSSASTGSTVFDFDGDGKAEVVYSDENHLRIYEGTTGNVLFSTCNTTGTLVEFPVVADVDNDGHADIVVVSNAYASGNAEYSCNDGVNNAQSGVRVFGDANGTWVRTRRIWNEHAYHVTNVEEDGTIPAVEKPNFTQPGLNNFRQQKQPGSEFAAADAIVSIAPLCPGPQALVATVRNVGQAALPAGVVVGFYEGSPPSGTKLGEGATTHVLYPAEAEEITLLLVNPDAGLVSGATPVYAVADDTMVPHPSWHECRTDDNTSAATPAKCDSPK